MSMDIASVSYGLAAAMFGMLSVLLLTAWRGRLQGGLLVLAAATSCVWCTAQSAHAALGAPPFWTLQLLELVRDVAWFAFILQLFRPRAEPGERLPRSLRGVALGIAGVSLALLVVIVGGRLGLLTSLDSRTLGTVNLLGFLIIAVIGVVLVHQLYRDTRAPHRWAIKFLIFGLTGLFAYDLYLYSLALLFNQLDPAVWAARGLVNAIVVPFVVISARRNPIWSVEVFVSRQVVFHSTALVVVGVYLILMAAAGYYIRLYGGSWGGVAQVGFIFLALLLLAVLLLSGQARARLKVLLNKHFFKNRYDYRQEWLKFTRTLSEPGDERDPRERLIRAFGDIVDSERGVIWVRQSSDYFQPVAALNLPVPEELSIESSAPLPRFLQDSAWIVDIDEFGREPGRYLGLIMPDWVTQLRDPWAVVPLMHLDELLGFIFLTRPVSPRELNWEDSDLLKTCGRQAASYLALHRISEALQDARQFEAFNRLSAFVVHDLKNLVAQLSLVVSNAERHMNSPGFIEDAIATVDNAAAKMNRLLAQLRKDRGAAGSVRALKLGEALAEIVQARSASQPVPSLELTDGELMVSAEPDRLSAVVEHLVQNAQEATAAHGSVALATRRDGSDALVEVRDTGCGMDSRFISERLFRPFDTTKGNAGMGVGVYEAREFAMSHGGSLDVSSTPGKGTVFRLRLPLERGGVHDPAVADVPQQQEIRSMEASG